MLVVGITTLYAWHPMSMCMCVCVVLALLGWFVFVCAQDHYDTTIQPASEAAIFNEYLRKTGC